MSVQRSKDGARKRDPGGEDDGQGHHLDPTDTTPLVHAPLAEQIVTDSAPGTPLTPSTPVHPPQPTHHTPQTHASHSQGPPHPIIYSTRMPNPVTVTRTHAGRVLTRTDTGVSIPPNFFLDDTVSPRVTSITTSLINTGVVKTLTTTTTSVPTRVLEGTSMTRVEALVVEESPTIEVTPSGESGGNGWCAGVDADFNTPKKWATGTEGDDERILLNVGGVRHETHVSTLRVIPNSRLSRLAEMHVQAGGGPQEYFFDRHPAVFNAIIDFYRTGTTEFESGLTGKRKPAIFERTFLFNFG